jgi:hypothetical protein
MIQIGPYKIAKALIVQGPKRNTRIVARTLPMGPNEVGPPCHLE